MKSFSSTLNDLANAVNEHIPEAQIQFQPSGEMMSMPSTQSVEMDDTNAQQDWGWKPEYGLKKAVEDFVVEVTANRALYESQ